VCASRFLFWVLFFFFKYWDLNSGPCAYLFFFPFSFFCSTGAWNSGPTPWATPPALFVKVSFWDTVSQTICPGWLQTMILQMSASWVARIIGVSHPLIF
jgi:hypothetical protein